MLENTEGSIKYEQARENVNKRQRIPKGLIKMNNPEKLATQGTQDEESQNKNTQQYMLDTAICKQIQIVNDQ